MIHYLFIELAADNINVAQPPVWSVSPYSVSSFLRAFQQRVNEADQRHEFFVEGFSVIQHSLQGYSGMLSGAGMEPTTKGNVDKHAINHGFPYKLLASGRFTFIAEVEFTEVNIDDSRLKQDARKVLQNMKFLGGGITQSRFKGPFTTENGLRKEMGKNIGSGLLYKLDDRCLKGLIQNDKSPAEALLWATQPMAHRGDTKKMINKPGANFASLIGYQLLEAPKNRSGVRESAHKHAFAEPVFSVIERTPVTRYFKGKSSLHDLGVLWQKTFDAKSNTLYVHT